MADIRGILSCFRRKAGGCEGIRNFHGESRRYTALAQVAKTTQQIAGGAKDQSKELEASTKIVADLSKSIGQGAANAKSAAEITQEASKLAQKGTDASPTF